MTKSPLDEYNTMCRQSATLSDALSGVKRTRDRIKDMKSVRSHIQQHGVRHTFVHLHRNWSPIVTEFEVRVPRDVILAALDDMITTSNNGLKTQLQNARDAVRRIAEIDR